jgi:hypothetical protein
VSEISTNRHLRFSSTSKGGKITTDHYSVNVKLKPIKEADKGYDERS